MIKTILILAANPKDTSRLRLDQEVREITNGLQRSQKRDELTLQQIWAARPADVRRAMLDFRPSIVHFCGHGTGEEGIAFEDDDGNTKLVNAETLSDFFQLFADRVECIILNACYSEVQAEAIAKHVKYVIGMKKAIGDKAAIEFATAFYDAIGTGETVNFAYKLGCNAIQWKGISQNLIPILKSQENNILPDEARKDIENGSSIEQQNIKRPLPIFILLDTSGSMTGIRIHLMRQGIVKLIEYLQWHNRRIEPFLSIITFGDQAKVLILPTPVTEIMEIPEITAGGSTALGKALRLLADLFDMSTLPKRVLRPLIIVALDGYPSDEWENSLTALTKSVLGSRADRLVLAIGDDVDYKVMRKIGNLGVLPLIHPEDMLQITNFFKWISSSILSIEADSTLNLSPLPDGISNVW